MEVKRHINPKACGSKGGWKQKVVCLQSSLYSQPPGGRAWTARRLMCFQPIFWVRLWTAGRLRVARQATQRASSYFFRFGWFVSDAVVFGLYFYCTYLIDMMNYEIVVTKLIGHCMNLKISWISIGGLMNWGFHNHTKLKGKG